MPIKRDFGLRLDRQNAAEHDRLISYINIKLSSMGLPIYSREGTAFVELASDMLENFREKDLLLADYLPPPDRRIQDFLDSYLGDLGLQTKPRLPSGTLVLDRYGMARELSLPPDKHKYSSPSLTSYRVRNGVLHNPASDRRTTEGVFHVADGGLPVPPDKKEVPKLAFARLLAAALNPPADLLELPFTAGEERKARTLLSLLLRPTVRPGVHGWCEERAMELRFFAPGSLAASLDFIESIFGNAGDPYVAENDAALDPLRWTGTTGCIILATHLTSFTKKELGLPTWEKATDRQRREGMAWKDPDEPYNDGRPFKICARDDRGVIVSVIADNYFGYSKKEVKAQISYSANLLGLAEEEHAGGALVFPSYNLGTLFVPDTNLRARGHSLDGVLELMGGRVSFKEEGYAVDLTFPQVVYLPEDAVISLEDQTARWSRGGVQRSLRILPDKVYVHPTGYRIRMERHPGSGAWRLVGTASDGLLCHKPCTVSGGGKSEIAKSILDAITYSPLIIGDYRDDMAAVKAIMERDYSNRFKGDEVDRRDILSKQRSLGSVIKLLSPSPLFTDDYNAWLRTIPERIKALVFFIKRFYQPDWGGDWASRFTVDAVNGTTGNILKFEGRAVLGSYLRVGRDETGMRRTFKLRQDFMPAAKVQWEDDITASVTVPASRLSGLPYWVDPTLSIKFCKNIEARFFQRPDDAVVRGYDRQAERDLARRDNFISNFEPLPRSEAGEMSEKCVSLTTYSEPMREFVEGAANDKSFEWFVASDRPRMVNGAPSKNPRYLQLDPSYVDPLSRYLADLGPRLYRRVRADERVMHPVSATLPGRRNNPADPASGIRPLAVYGPIHYQDLPELFMDFVCSLTGKSPSTTGAGSEGALTKGPFNCLSPTTDLNNALLSFILTGYGGFTTAAGHIGRKYRMEHDLSLLVPELWARMGTEERNPENLKRSGYLERIEDFEYEGETVPASRLGWRITPLFVTTYLGRIFDTPSTVFSDDMLRPELQSLPDFVDGVRNIAEAQAKSAAAYFEDGSVEAAIPPLKAILHVMAKGSYQGRSIHDPGVRELFERNYVLHSDWYRDRLESYRDREADYVAASVKRLRDYLAISAEAGSVAARRAKSELARAEERLAILGQAGYMDMIEGSIGLDPLFRGASKGVRA
jgi:phosphoenolpyruvate carboxykinase (diphosphate)